MWGGVLYYEGEVEVKKTLVKSIKISFQEKTSKGFVDRSFDTPKEHLEFHLQQMKKSPGVIRGVSFKNV